MSSLKILEPIEVLPANVGSNIALEEEWVAGTYTLGQQRRVGDTLYEVVANTTDDDPISVTTEWVNIGPANRYAAFDLQVGADKYRILETVSKRDGLVEFVLTGLSRITQITLSGLVATQVRVIVSTVDSGQILNISYDLSDAADYNGSFWAWCFLPKDLETQYILNDINIPSGATITIRVVNAGATAHVANIAMGVTSEFGTVTIGTSKKLRPRAFTDFDGLLATLIPRRPTYVVSYKIVLQENSAGRFWRKIEGLAGKPAVFSGSDSHPEYLSYGYIESADGSEVGGYITKASIDIGTI